jgi:hypothetical protein
MSSDSTGEIYMITKADGSGVDNVRGVSHGAAGGSQGRNSLSPAPSAGHGMRNSHSGHGNFKVAGAALAVGALPMVFE